MELKISTNNINTSYQYTTTKNSNTNSSFTEQLRDSIDISTNKVTNAPIYSNLATLKNVNANNASTEYSNEEIQKRKAEIQKLQNEYDSGKYDPYLCMPKVNTKTMEKVLDLQIQNNKDTYYDSNGKLNINKILEDCGISLNNATPIELQSLRSELKGENLIDDDIDNNLDTFINRAFSDNFSNGNYSKYDVYNNIKFNVLEKANYFKGIDHNFNDLINYNIDNTILGFFK